MTETSLYYAVRFPSFFMNFTKNDCGQTKLHRLISVIFYKYLQKMTETSLFHTA